MRIHCRSLIYAIEQYKIQFGLFAFIINTTLLLPMVLMIERVGSEPSVKPAIISASVAPVPTMQSSAAQPALPESPKWPLHGRVTTEYGISHMPWQRIHTGIDITSGQGSGSAAIHPFKEGTVQQTVYSFGGYGKHVIVDHGNGITSLYAHLYSISVVPGQQVGQTDIIGYEGNTGVSTGTHLHFEIRQNGATINPRHFFVTGPQ